MRAQKRTLKLLQQFKCSIRNISRRIINLYVLILARELDEVKRKAKNGILLHQQESNL